MIQVGLLGVGDGGGADPGGHHGRGQRPDDPRRDQRLHRRSGCSSASSTRRSPGSRATPFFEGDPAHPPRRLPLLQLHDADHHRLRQPGRRPGSPGEMIADLRDAARPDLPGDPGRRAGQPLATRRGAALQAQARSRRRGRSREPDAPGARSPTSRRARPCRSSAARPACRGRRSACASIASTTSIPSTTSPKTVCLPSSHGAAPSGDDEELRAVGVGPGVGHRQRAADDLVVVELVLEGVARAAGAGPLAGSRPGP